MHVSFIIPAFNEELVIEQCLGSITHAIAANKTYGYMHEIIVVDNNSTDDTARLANEQGLGLCLNQSTILHVPELWVQMQHGEIG